MSFEELSVAQVLSGGEKVRAEEVVLEVPDGRRVTALINATPIRSEDGSVESCVVTLQDMTHLEELDRQRSDFLAVVSHELRAPLAAIKGSAATVLGDTCALDSAEMAQFFHIINRPADGEGSGWGLSICKGIVEAHGGRIWAESDGLEKGTRVTFTIPVAEDARYVSHGAPDSDAGRERGTVQGRTPILVVDDDPQTLRNVREALSKVGYLSVATSDPEEVPRLLEEHRPHLVLLDLVLPGTDGIEIMQTLLKDASMPVVFLSAYGYDEAIARAFEAGAADYVVKPFSPTELVARIRAALRRSAAPVEKEPEEPLVLDGLTVDFARRRVAVGGRPVKLTVTEYRLLVELSVNAGSIVTHRHLLQRVWRKTSGGDTRPLRSVIKSLRRKLGDDAGHPDLYLQRTGHRLSNRA